MADKYTYQTLVGVSCPKCGHLGFITRDGAGCKFECDRCLNTFQISTNNVLEAKAKVEDMKNE